MKDPDSDLEDELSFHLEMRVQELVRQGETPERARAIAEKFRRRVAVQGSVGRLGPLGVRRVRRRRSTRIRLRSRHPRRVAGMTLLRMVQLRQRH